MANQEIRLKTELRTEQGSSAAGRLRRAGTIPAAVNRIKGGTTLVKFNAHEFKTLLRHHVSKQMLVTLEMDGQDVFALMREVQSDVITGYPIHVDFGEVSMTEKIRVTVPLVLVGEPEGVKVGGGILQQMIREIDVECLPTNLVEEFDIDATPLKLSQSLFVRDLNLGDAYTIHTGKDNVVVTVAAPEEDAAATAEGQEPSPEIITKGKKEEAASAATSAAKK